MNKKKPYGTTENIKKIFTIRKGLKTYKFHPYKMQIIHELHEDDFG